MRRSGLVVPSMLPPWRSPPAVRSPRRLSKPAAGHTGEITGFAAGSVEGELGQLRSGADAELGEDVAEVELDRPGAEEQLGGDLPGGQPLGDEPGHLELLGGELPEGGRVAPAGGLAAGAQLLPCPLRPRG